MRKILCIILIIALLSCNVCIFAESNEEISQQEDSNQEEKTLEAVKEAVKLEEVKNEVEYDEEIEAMAEYILEEEVKESIVEEKEVSAGELIGYTGETGNAHGAHLHMEVKENGKAISPFNVFKMRYWLYAKGDLK